MQDESAARLLMPPAEPRPGALMVIEDRQGRQRVDGVDPSGDGWDGSPCGYRDAFVGFVYREERERRR